MSNKFGNNVIVHDVDKLQKENKKLQNEIELLKRNLAKIKDSVDSKHSVEKLHSIMQAMRDVILEIDKDGTYIYIAPTSPDLLFKPADNLLGKKLHDVFSKQQADNFLIAIRESIQKNEITTMQYSLDIMEKEIWFEAKITPKSVDTVLFVAHEITERIKTYEELKASKERYHNIFDSANVSIWEEDFSQLKTAIDNLKLAGVLDFHTYLNEHPEFITEALKMIKVLDVNYETLKMYKADNKEELLDWFDKKAIDASNSTVRDEIIAIAEGKDLFISEKIILNMKGELIHTLFKMSIPKADESFENMLISMMDISKQKEAEKINTVMLRILESIETTKSLKQLYKAIHLHLSSVLNTSNFYVALYDETKEFLNFSYHIDQKTTYKSYPAQNTLSDYVIKSGKPLFADRAMIQSLREQGKIGKAKKGSRAEVWIGVPLLQHNKPLGIVAVRSYENEKVFSKNDMMILEFVSDTIALAITRKQNEKKLIENEQRYRDIYNTTQIGLYRTTPAGEILMVNQATLNMMGYDSMDQLYERNLEKDGYAPDYSRQSFKMIMEEIGEIKGKESTWIKKDGSKIYVRESAKVVRDDNGEVLYYDGVVEDITEKKRRDTINNVLLKISQSAASISGLNPLIHKIREHLSELLETKNFGVAICNDNDTYTYPYYIDQNEEVEEGFVEYIPNSLTSFCRKTGEILLVDDKNMEKLKIDSDVQLIGPDSKVWLGVPLKTSRGIIGVLSLQSYDDVHAYTEDDLQILASVAGSIAIQIEKKQAETDLRRSEAQLALALESAQLGLWDLDNRTGKIYRNDIWAEMLGYSTDEIKNDLNFFESIVHPDDMQELRYKSDNAGKFLGAKFDVEHRLKTKDGNWKWIRDWGRVVEWDDNNKPLRIIGTHLDIDEEKRLRLALTNSEEKYRKLFESSTDFMCVIGMDSTFLDVNTAAESITGFPKSKLIGMNFMQYTTPQTKHRLLRAFKKNLNKDRPLVDFPMELNIGCKGVRHFEGSIVPIKQEGVTVGFQGSARDVTSRLKNEKLLLKHQEHIKLINRILRHDIASCFSVINSALNIYRRSNDLSMIDESVKQITKGIKLIKRMKQLEESYLANSSLKIYNLKKVVTNLAKYYSEMDVEITGEGKVLADEALDPTIDNLISNVYKHAQASELHIDIATDNKSCVLAISDNGVGIADEIKQNIFKESFKYGSSGHTGLGLYIVKKTIERYGGSVTVKNNVPEGTIFKLKFPLV